MKDTSLKGPLHSGTYGIVMDVKVSSKKEKEMDKDKVVPNEVKKAAKQIQEEHRVKTDELREQLTEALEQYPVG